MADHTSDPLLHHDIPQDGEYGSTKSTAAEIASGFPLIVTAAERRAHAVYYSFTLLCIGLLVLLVVVLIESHRWRSTITTESEAWRALMIKFEDDLGKHFSAGNNPEL